MIRIPYGRQDISGADVDAVARAMRDALITQGPRVGEFEECLAAVTGARFAVAFNSGTAGLHAAYFAAGVGPGAVVITTPITFVATANAALYLGGNVRFADVDPGTIQLDSDQLADIRDEAVRVVAPVHFGGHVGRMHEIAVLARRRGWMIVEDAAHALGGRYRTPDGGEHCVGACAHSDMCCFSFHPVKHITTGEGGAVTTNDPRLAARLRCFRTHGITREPGELRADEGPWYYEQHDLGFNYRLTDFQCALGVSQLERLPDFLRRRREIAALYDRAFAGDREIVPVVAPPGSAGAYHLYVVRVPPAVRRRVFEGLRNAGIGVQVHYIPVYRQPYYRTHGFGGLALPNAEAYYARAITLPVFFGLTDVEVAEVSAEVKREVQGALASVG